MNFNSLGLPDPIVKAVEEKGYTTPTPIQEKAIPLILAGKDLIGSAQTGTGKTAAFLLPLLTRLSATPTTAPGPRVLIIEPTRELACQIQDNILAYSRYLQLRGILIYGGVAYPTQLKQLKEGTDIITATPGRFLDHLRNQKINLQQLETLVLDEIDRMLDMGFINQIREIVQACPTQRQTLLFSATIPTNAQTFIQKATNKPITVTIGTQGAKADTVEHAIFPVHGLQKYDLLLALLQAFNYQSILVFTRTKIDADRLADWLTRHHHKVATLHANRTQSERKQALDSFKNGHCPILVATDIASRGLDISNVTHVINYNVPEFCEDYIHRIGRTGRALQEGEALTLFSSEESSSLKAIERYLGAPIKRQKLPEFPYRTEPQLNPNPTPRKKKRNRGF